jgi:very-short-patch-repair endonuclease
MANENARKLRKRLTPQEVKLWNHLRALKPFGHHFRRQTPIGNYIVDFACFSQRLVIEVDGGQNGLPDGIRRDAQRDAFLAQHGFRVLRFWNSDIDQNLQGVADRIVEELSTPTPTG